MFLIGHDNWGKRLPDWGIGFSDNLEDIYGKNKKVTILRHLNFFYVGQKTTLEAVRKIYTTLAINNMVHDKFIEIHD